MQISFDPTDLLRILPFIVVAVFSMITLLVDVFSDKGTDKTFSGYVAFAGLLIAFVLNLLQWGDPSRNVMFSMLTANNYSVFFNAIILFAAGFSVLSATGYFKEHGMQRGEFYALLLMSVSGMMLMGQSNDLLTFFIALELMSIPIYVLAAFMRHRNESVEAGLKYFLMGAFSTAFLLYGISFVYGAMGTTGFDDIKAHFDSYGYANQPFMYLGMIFILIGFCFKVAAVPFHMWTPDVYQGAPTVVTGFMATAVKAAAFAAFVKIFITIFFPLKLGAFGWYNVLWVVAILTMTLGNLTALVQDNIKRMLAYSSIAHAGYILVGFLSMTQSKGNNGASSVLFYLLVYAVMNLGAFAVVILFGKRGNENQDITKGWAGIGLRNPALGVAMSLFLLSLAGIPPTAGFMGKFYIFTSAIDQGLYILAIIGIINSIISVYYYLRVMVYMYMVESEEQTAGLNALPVQVVVFSACALVLYLGIFPSDALAKAQEAVSVLF